MPISVFKPEHQDKLRKFDADGGGKLDADVSSLATIISFMFVSVF